MKITHRATAKVLYEDEQTTIKATVEAAVKIGADLRGADLRNAYLGNADLVGADLGGADLVDADLVDARIKESDTSALLAAIGIEIVE